MMWRLKVFILLGILLLSPVVLAGRGQPDLVVREIQLNPAEPEPGDRVQLSATIANEGRGDVRQSFDVRFRVDDMTIGRQRVMRLRAGRTVEVQAQWQAVAGEHRITVEVDRPFNRIHESNERNNSREITVTIHHKAAVYSITAEVILTVGESLQTTGELLHLTVGSDIFAAIDQGVEQLEQAQLTLDEAGRKLIQIEEGLPPPLSQDVVITKGQAIGEVFQRMGDSLGTVASALRSFNVNVAVTALRELEAQLNELSRLSFARVQLGRLAEAASYVEEVALTALALQTSFLGSDSSSASDDEAGETTDELIADFQTALGRAGDLIGAVGSGIAGLPATRGICITDAEGQSLVEYHSGETLLIQVYGAVSLMFEVYDPEGRLVARRVVIDDRLRWQGSSLPAGEYFYRLQADRGAGEETDIGRILIS